MTKKLNKKRGLIAAAFLLFAVGGILAYMSGNESKRNILTVGNVTTTIVEDFEPGEITKKEVVIKNTGKSPCYVRTYVAFSDLDIEKISRISSVTGEDKDADTWYNAFPDKDSDGKIDAEAYVAHLPEGWVFIPEETDPRAEAAPGGNEPDEMAGWFYYTKVLRPNKSTTPLFGSVRTDFEHAEDKVDYDIIVSHESIQILDKDGKPFDTTDDLSDATAYRKAWSEYLNRK